MVAWDHVNRGFCEQAFGGYPENFNAYSSFFIVWIGVWGLFGSRIAVTLTRLIYSALAVAGVGSFLLHFYGFELYGLIDIVPMLLAAWYINLLTWRFLAEHFIRDARWSGIANDVLALVTTVLLALSLALINVDGTVFEFTQIFAFPNISSAFAALTLSAFRRKHADYRWILAYTLTGFVMLVAFAALWLSTEPYCKPDDPDVPAWFQVTHALWHVFFTWGAHLMIQALLMHTSAASLTAFRTAGTPPASSSSRCAKLLFAAEQLLLLLFPLAEPTWRPDLPPTTPNPNPPPPLTRTRRMSSLGLGSSVATF
jgi:hypothetical protein